MIRPYEFKEGISYVRMLPNIDKNGNIGSNYKEITFYVIKPDNSKWIRFYSEDASLNKAISEIGYKKIRDGGIQMQKRVFFYGIVDNKVEMISVNTRLFNDILTQMTKEIANGRSPLDPRSGVGFKITSTLDEETKLPRIEGEFKNNLTPISIGNTREQCLTYITTRETDMDDYLDQYNMNKHKRKSEIYTFISNNDDLIKWKSEFREKRLGELLDKKTDK